MVLKITFAKNKNKKWQFRGVLVLFMGPDPIKGDVPHVPGGEAASRPGGQADRLKIKCPRRTVALIYAPGSLLIFIWLYKNKIENINNGLFIKHTSSLPTKNKWRGQHTNEREFLSILRFFCFYSAFQQLPFAFLTLIFFAEQFV